jgi:hypothetical protein
LRSTTRIPSPPWPGRAIALAALLGTALAVAGAGTASAATSGPVTSRTATVTHHAPTHKSATQHINTGRITEDAAVAGQRAAKQAAPQHAAKQAAPQHAAKRAAASDSPAPRALTSWQAITHAAAGRATGPLPASDRLLPAAISGPQDYLPMTPDRAANAATIVRQALAKHMGVRSAVIAVATAMQESQLENINYGTYDSLGLFQQQPDMGWGTAAQVTDPAYASDAFLGALRQYQENHPDWATQPLWQAAQGVQNSGFPYAYAKWEDQAAHIVASVVKGMY